MERVVETPARSVARTWTTWDPSERLSNTAVTPPREVKGPLYDSQGPSLTRYSTVAMPLTPSKALRVTTTSETYQPFEPIVAASVPFVVGAVGSTFKESEPTGLLLPARSVE